MKNLLKKSFAILCAVMLLLTCSITAMANQNKDGKIEINNAVPGHTYTVYKMATLSYDAEKDAYAYTPVEEWKAFFENSDAYVINEAGYIEQSSQSFDMVQVAKDALAYVATYNATYDPDIAVAATKTTGDEETAITFTLDYGYYLIDSTLGTLCALNTHNDRFEFEEKNAQPTAEKQVEENGAWGTTNDADIGDVVNYKVTVNIDAAGAENYVLHDVMSEGLTFSGTITATLNGVDMTENDDYELVTEGLNDGCTFEVKFTETFCDSLKKDDTIVITYSATLNNNAVVAGEGNPNTIKLAYGDANNLKYTTESIVTTYTYEFDLVKTDSASVILDGATFELYASENGNDEIALTKISDGVYRIAFENEVVADTFTTKDGKATIIGLDTATYWIKEITPPTGYNKLTAREDVEIAGANNKATVELDKYVSGGVQVVNKSGNVLPETGSFGTTMFILIGGGVALMAAVLLVTKKRMAKIAD